MQNFRTYNLSIQFLKDCQSLKLPSIARDQFDRAALSIALNLAEGSAKPTEKDRKKFYFIAFGSIREVQTILKIYGSDKLNNQADILAAHLYRLCNSHCARSP